MGVAQSAEHLPSKQVVTSSNLVSHPIFPVRLMVGRSALNAEVEVRILDRDPQGRRAEWEGHSGYPRAASSDPIGRYSRCESGPCEKVILGGLTVSRGPPSMVFTERGQKEGLPMAEEMDPDVYADPMAVLRQRAEAAGFRVAKLEGISVGGCSAAIGTPRRGAFREQAHAHNHPRDPMFGWICILSAKVERLRTPTGRPTALLAHEYAHLLAPSTGHGERWRKAVTALGHPAEAKRAEKARRG